MLNCIWLEIICGSFRCGFCVVCRVIIVLLRSWLMSRLISD